MSGVVRFDEALVRMVSWARGRRANDTREVWLLRDLTGHLRVLTDDSEELPDDEREALHLRIGAFSPGPRRLSLERSLLGTDDELARGVRPRSS